MARKPVPTAPSDTTEVVETLHPADADVEYTDVTGQDDLPAGVVDPNTDDGGDDQQQSATPTQDTTQAGDELPPELKGKSAAEIARMYLNAQQVLGRQGSELGELRKVADTYLQAHLLEQARKKSAEDQTVKTKKPKDEDALAEFFADPRTAIANEIANHPSLKDLQGEARRIAAQQIADHRRSAEIEFNTTHPDAKEVLGDPEFQQWVMGSPIRQQLLLRAHQQYDLTAANEVFNTWKALKGARASKVQEPGRKVAVSKTPGKVPTGGNAAPRQAGGKSQKIYRRADVIRLMTDDPDRYAMMADEITQAYTEGRVR